MPRLLFGPTCRRGREGSADRVDRAAEVSAAGEEVIDGNKYNTFVTARRIEKMPLLRF